MMRIFSLTQVGKALLAPAVAFCILAGTAVLAQPALAVADLSAGQTQATGNSLGVSTQQSLDSVVIEAFVKTKKTTSVIHEKRVRNVRYLFLPSYASLEDLHISQANGKALLVAKKRKGVYRKITQESSLDISRNSQKPTGAYRIFVKTSKKSEPFVVKVMKSAKIRTMYLVSDDPENYGRDYIESSSDHSLEAQGHMTFIGADGSVVYKGRLDQIKGRGNSTWVGTNKKPYQIKLSTKTSLLDGTDENAAKTWVLLANAFDDTLSRNYIAYKMAKAIGMENAPDCEFVDLYYDGEYLGNYLLSEKVQIGSGRVDIVEQENESEDEEDIEDHDIEIGYNDYGYEFQYVKDVKTPQTLQVAI